jgi:glycerol uptake facilitator-like aquaporin
MDQDLPRRLLAECVGTAFLLATVVGSGIMADRLAGGNVAVALLANSVATGAILFVLITMFGPISGAHFNPAVTAIFLMKREMTSEAALATVGRQCAGALAGMLAAHLTFDETAFQLSVKVRWGPSQWFSEGVATFGLVSAILLTRRSNPAAIPAVVGLYITAAYWFTASTSFANRRSPSLARSPTRLLGSDWPMHPPSSLLSSSVPSAPLPSAGPFSAPQKQR